MPRFYVDRVTDDTVIITDPGQLHHLKDVLRLQAGESAEVFDAEGNEYSGMISAMEKSRAVIKVTPCGAAPFNKLKLTIACAIPKGDRMDDVVDQLTQLGVERIIPMLTERVVVRLDEAKKASRLKRWGAIAQSAAEQSRRNTLPVIDPVSPFTGVITNSQKYDLKLIPNLEGERKPIKEALGGEASQNILVLIGPEGDFTPDEVGSALKAGFIPVSLGDPVLRVATAAVAVAAYIRFARGI
jgi:16S rRNA (uracil1498-N3)-methyltransferase